MGAHDGGPTLITSVQRALRLLEAVSAHANGAPAKKLARETGLPLATPYHLLRTLVHDGYIRKRDDGGWCRATDPQGNCPPRRPSGATGRRHCTPGAAGRRCSTASAPRSPLCGT